MKRTTPKTWIEISKKNLLRNLGEFKKRSGKTAIMAVIKANAYGHGLKEVASMLKTRPETMLGVDSLEEALLARSAAPKNEIMILGYVPKKDLKFAIKKRFHVSLYDKEILAHVNQLIKTGAINAGELRAHLKIETGTNRLGIRPEEIKNINIPKLEGVYTHLAESESIKSNFYKKQVATLAAAKKILLSKNIVPKFTHTSCTAAIIQRGALGGNLVRLGIGLYGLWPSEELEKKFSGKIRIKPVLSWKTRLAQVKKVPAGETVGYDRTHKAKAGKTIGIVPVGYYDGLDRRLSNTGNVLVNGKVAKIIGRVCMNMTMVDLSGASAKSGDEIVLIGRSGKKEISADEVAKEIGTINYEIVARINPLTPRVIN